MPKPILSPGLLGLPTDADEAAKHLLQFFGPLQIPLGAPGAGHLSAMFTTTLPWIGSHFRMPAPTFVQSISNLESLSQVIAPQPFSTALISSHPEWKLGLELSQEGPPELQMIYVGEVLLSVWTRLPPRVLRLREALNQWRETRQMPAWVTSTLADLLTRLVQAFDRGAQAAPEVRRRLASERIALQLRQQVRLPLKSGVRIPTFKRQFVAAPPTSVVRIASG